MNIYGLIGYPLTHSFSKKYFSEKFEKENLHTSVYQNFEIDSIARFKDIIATNPQLNGLNVTIPYKEKVIDYLDELDPEAKEIGAVNTIKFTENVGLLKTSGFNTDIFGFEESINPLLQPEHKKALILGTGGASKAIEYVLKKKNINFLHVSRNNANGKSVISYNDLTPDVLNEYTIIINTTPLGMYPDIHSCPELPWEYVGQKHLLYDLVYNPDLTKFMSMGLEQGAQVKNGLEMLHLQAEKAWEIWNR